MRPLPINGYLDVSIDDLVLSPFASNNFNVCQQSETLRTKIWTSAAIFNIAWNDFYASGFWNIARQVGIGMVGLSPIPCRLDM